MEPIITNGTVQTPDPAGTPAAAQPAPNLAPPAAAPDAIPPALAVGEISRINETAALEQIRNTLFAIDEVTYLWSIADDQLTWADNLNQVLPGLLPGRADTGRGYASLLDHENEDTRYDKVVQSSDVDQGEGVGYCIEYKLWPSGMGKGEPIWIEDKGRWYAGLEGSAGYAVGAVRSVNTRRAREESLTFLSQCDPLTGMMNRGRIMEALSEDIAAAERTGNPCSFILAALDNLDVVNDAYGFDVADQVIASVSQRLARHMRNGDSIGRYAGNKFGIILSNCNEKSLNIAAERFLQAVRQTVIETDNGPVWTTVSIGGVVLPTHARHVHEAMVHAEDALAEAKSRPTDCFITYKPSKRRASMRERNVNGAGEIVAALKQNRFVLAFQPIMDSMTGQPAIYEALLRVAGHDGEIMSAGHLLPIAEKLGLIRLIDRRVLEMGITVLQRQPELRLSINISGVTATDTRWFEMFVDYIAENKQVAERLTIEITETVALADLEEMIQFIERLRSFGCKVAIDDFGAGYTSFRNLQVLNVDMVKLDGSFCESLADNPDNQYFVKTLVDMAKRFDVEIVAEWVQKQEDADLLREWGVKYLQGHLYGVASIDPPWGRLEWFGSDSEPEHDPVRKVLHAGKPDLPSLWAGGPNGGRGGSWSPQTHPERRSSDAPPVQAKPAREAPATAAATPPIVPALAEQESTLQETTTVPAVAPTTPPVVPQSALQPQADPLLVVEPNTAAAKPEAPEQSQQQPLPSTLTRDRMAPAQPVAPVTEQAPAAPQILAQATPDRLPAEQSGEPTPEMASQTTPAAPAPSAPAEEAGQPPFSERKFDPFKLWIDQPATAARLEGKTADEPVQPDAPLAPPPAPKPAAVQPPSVPAGSQPAPAAADEDYVSVLADGQVIRPQYDGLQPAPEFEPAQPSANIAEFAPTAEAPDLAPHQEQNPAVPAAPRPHPQGSPVSQPIVGHAPLPPSTEDPFAAPPLPPKAPAVMPDQAMQPSAPPQPEPPAQPAAVDAQSDEFAQKLNSAFGHIMNGKSS
ncbi:MAG: EAL domain-containing protein [Rhizobiales bacterium]|nr:EAL domain-containing protein [Hyphomicrobiales bacterium]